MTLASKGAGSHTGAALEQISASGSVVYFHHDQLGSTRLLTDAGGAVLATYDWAPCIAPSDAS